MNQSTVVEGYELKKPLFHKMDSIFDNCIRDFHQKNFHTFGHICVYDIKLTKIGKYEKRNLTISDKNMALSELNKKIKVARQNGFIFNQKQN